MLTGALITGGVGPWLPFQTMAAGCVEFLAGCLPRAGRRNALMLVAAYAGLAGLAYGLVMNIWFWPFASYGPEVSYVAGDPLVENLRRYAVFYLTTSLPWDLGRSLLSIVVILLAGSALLPGLRRAGRRAAFGAPVVFER